MLRVGYATHRARNAFLTGLGVGALLGLGATIADKEHDPDGPLFGAVVFGLPLGGVLAGVFSDRALYTRPVIQTRASPVQ